MIPENSNRFPAFAKPASAGEGGRIRSCAQCKRPAARLRRPRSIKRPDVPGKLRDEEHQVARIEMVRGKDGKLYRPARRDNVVRCLQSCFAYLSTLPDADDDMSKLKGELQNALEILKRVDFPGMSG